MNSSNNFESIDDFSNHIINDEQIVESLSVNSNMESDVIMEKEGNNSHTDESPCLSLVGVTISENGSFF